MTENDAVDIPIEDHLDLHAFAPRDIPDVVAEYLEVAWHKGFREVRLIHGRGIGAQRAVVHRILHDHPRVASFHDAPEARLGATIAVLAFGLPAANQP